MHATERRALRPYASKAGRVELDGIGLGRIGVTSFTRAQLLAQVKTQLGLAYLLVAGPVEGPAGNVAVAAGAGGELLEDAIRAGADVFVTGEVRHHDALSAARRGVTVIATLHSNSERAAVRSYGQRLATRLGGVEVAVSTQDRDPFTVL